MKKNKIICLLILIGIGLLLSFKNVNASTIQISYRTHVQNLGWQTFVKMEQWLEHQEDH